MLFPTNWNVLIGFTDRYFLLWLEPFLYVTTGHCLQVFKLETNTPTLMNELLVSRPTRWYLSFWYLDFYLNHLFPKPDNREILTVQRCARIDQAWFCLSCLRRRGGLLSQWHWPGVSSSHSLGVFACLSVLDFTMATWHLLASGHYSLTLPFVSLRQSYAVIFLVRVKEDDIIIKTLKTSKSFYIYLSQYYLVLHIWGNTSWEKKRFLWVLPK